MNAVRERTSSERLRSPAPLLPRRVPSGRRAMEQPNALGDGEARLTIRFWLALVVTGVAAGLAGLVMAAVLHGVQGLADSHSGQAPGAHRLVVLLLGGFVTALAMWGVRRWTGDGHDLDDAVWSGAGRVPFLRSLGSGTVSEIAVGAGASLGQEGAPKVLGAAGGALVGGWLRLDDSQRRVLVACGAGAGMGAIYNVPLGGALVTAELLLGSLTLPALLPALLCSGLATLTTWLVVANRPTYTGVGHLEATPGLVAWSLLLGPLLGLLGVGLVRAVGRVSHHQLRGRATVLSIPLAFLVLGLCALPLPGLLGNGRTIAATGFAGTQVALLTLVALVVLKPALTLLCLWSGSPGGLFTPMLSTGAALGLLAGELTGLLHIALPLAACAVIGAAALSGATMQAPLAATVLVIELTASTQRLALPILLATATATLVTRYVDGYSVFSARLPARSVAAP